MTDHLQQQIGQVPLVRIHEMSPSGELGRQMGIGTLVASRIVLVHPSFAEALAAGDATRLCIVAGSGWSRSGGPQQIPVLYVQVGRDEAAARDGEPALVVLELARRVQRIQPVPYSPFITPAEWAAWARHHLENPQGPAQSGIQRVTARLPLPLLIVVELLIGLIIFVLAILTSGTTSWQCKLFHIGC